MEIMLDIKNLIYTIRGIKVMLDSDLAKIYGYQTRSFNQQVKNNIEKFDEEVLYPEEYLVYGTCLGLKGLEGKLTEHNYCERLVEALNRCVVKAILSGNRSL